MTCFQRIVSQLKEREFKAAAEAASARKEVPREARGQTIVLVPTEEEEQEKRAPTHTGIRSMLHAVKVASYIEQGRIDTFELEQLECQMSQSSVLDLCFAKAGLVDRRDPKEVEEMPVEAEGEEAEERGDLGGENGLKEVKLAMWMIMTCSQTGSVAAM